MAIIFSNIFLIESSKWVKTRGSTWSTTGLGWVGL